MSTPNLNTDDKSTTPHVNEDASSAAIAKRYTDAAGTVRKTIVALEAQEEALTAQARSFTLLSEDRAREEDAYRYRTTTEREREIERQKEEDAIREKKYREQLTELDRREAEIEKTVALKLEEAKATFVQKEVDKAVAIRENQLKKQFEQEQALAKAQDATRFRELEIRNENLQKENDALKATNQKLVETQNQLNERMERVATKGLEAAGNLKSQTDAAMQGAVAGGSFGGGRRPGQ